VKDYKLSDGKVDWKSIQKVMQRPSEICRHRYQSRTHAMRVPRNAEGDVPAKRGVFTDEEVSKLHM
jgi:hypothetical protein